MIFVNKFRGKTPKVDAKLLPAGFGQEAQNVDLRSGSLKPMKGLTQIQAITKTGDIRTIYKIDDYMDLLDSDCGYRQGTGD